ncbi:MAG: hypothetical protein M3410_01860 [Acidobacteriota bacterium]|nr:hypothetical protein [Acidobacteriota bacterium]
MDLTGLNTKNSFVTNIDTRAALGQEKTILKRIAALFIATIVFCSATAFSQTRRRSTRPPTRVTRPTKPANAQQAGAARVADQIKNLTRFLYLLGGIAKGIEAVDDAARRNEASPAVVEQAKRNKDTVRTSIQNVREGLDALEIHFRATPELQGYYIKLVGAASGAATAEEQAAANQFDRAGRSLLDVVNRLTNVLLEMR